MAKVATKVPSWISKILLPEIRSIVKEEISNEVKVLDAKISALDSTLEERTKTLDSKIVALDSKLEERTKTLESEISSLRNEMLSLRSEMNARFDSIEKSARYFANTILFPPKQFHGIIVLHIHPPKAEKLIKEIESLLVKVKNYKGKLLIIRDGTLEIVEDRS